MGLPPRPPLPPERMQLIAEFESLLDYKFRDKYLLNSAIDQFGHEGALMHQRLEFLGDRAVATIVTRLVCLSILAPTTEPVIRTFVGLFTENVYLEARMKEAKWLDVPRFFRLPGNKAELADFAEAVIGAAFVDGGGPAAEKVVLQLYGGTLKPHYIRAFFAKQDFREHTQEFVGKAIAKFEDFSKDADRQRKFASIVNAFCEAPDLGVPLPPIENHSHFVNVMRAALCREVPSRFSNRLGLTVMGEAGLALRVLARTWRTIGGLTGEPFTTARTRLTETMRDRETLTQLAEDYGITDLSFDSSPRARDRLYLALIGASLLGGVPWVVEREADRLLMATSGWCAS